MADGVFDNLILTSDSAYAKFKDITLTRKLLPIPPAGVPYLEVNSYATDILGYLSVGENLSVTGNVSATGTISGGDITGSNITASGNIKISKETALLNIEVPSGVTSPILQLKRVSAYWRYYIQASNDLAWNLGGAAPKMVLTTAGQLQLSAQGSSGGLVLGEDANLYRDAANVLKTDDEFRAVGHVSSAYANLTRFVQLWNDNAIIARNLADLRFGFASDLAAANWTEKMRLTTAGQLQLPQQGSVAGLVIGSVQLFNNATNELRLASGDEMTFSDLVKIRTIMPYLEVDPTEEKDEIKDMLFDDDFNDPHQYKGVTGILTFQDTGETSHFTSLFGIVSYGAMPSSPYLCTTHHLAVRKDFVARGILKSYEGIVSLNGGYAGWAPSNNPFIWLAEGGDYGNKNTLEIRIVTDKDANPPTWGYGDLRCRYLTCHYIYIFDAVFANGWRLTEDPEESGMMLVRPDGSIAQKWR